MIGRLNHVGVATPSIDESLKVYRDVLGATKIHERFALPEQGVWVCFVDLPNSQVELIEPYDDGSPLTGFLAKNPKGGQHHVCFEVEDIFAARDDCAPRAARCWARASRASGRTGRRSFSSIPRTWAGCWWS